MGNPQVSIETKFGEIKLELLPDIAPKHVENFLKLTKEGFYDTTIFHRVIPGFMIQGGCPNTRPGAGGAPGTGGPGYNIDAEFNETSHVRGVLSMARAQDPDSAGCQFFIVTSDSKFLDRQYTAFGKVISGMEVADQIVGQPRNASDLPDERIEMTVKVISE